MLQSLLSLDWLVPAILLGLVCSAFWAARRRWRSHVRGLERRAHEQAALLNQSAEDIERLTQALEQTQQRLKRLRRLVAVDALTGIANRRHFDRALDREVRRACRDRIPVSLIFLDIDGFKHYNDTYGHVEGDTVLRTVAQAVDGMCRRGSDLAARYGGEEFVVLLPGTDATQASLYAERLRRHIWRLEIRHEDGPGADRLTISAGVATLTAEELAADPALVVRAPQVLVNSADAALYRAKCLGRNRVAVKSSTGPTIAAIELAS